MDRLLWLSWFYICTWDHGVINILYQEFIGGVGIRRPSENALYGVGDFSLLFGAQRMQRSSAVVASLLTHREIHFSDPSGGIWSEDPFIGEYSDAMVEVMILIMCGPTRRNMALGHHII